jgi:hypothetical protein
MIIPFWPYFGKMENSKMLLLDSAIFDNYLVVSEAFIANLGMVWAYACGKQLLGI